MSNYPDCPQCGKKYVVTLKSPDRCLLCFNGRIALINLCPVKWANNYEDDGYFGNHPGDTNTEENYRDFE